MFDIGFWELVLVAVVALVVIGPERLPKAARVAGMWIGRARRSLASVKAEIDRELRAQELQEILKKQAQSNPLETILEEPRAARSRAAGPEDGSKGPGSGAPMGSAPAVQERSDSPSAADPPVPRGNDLPRGQ